VDSDFEPSLERTHMAQRHPAAPRMLEVVEDTEKDRRPKDTDDNHARFVYSLMGRYVGVLSSSEEFMRRKRIEIDWEDKNIHSRDRSS
jgi:hypothetical protein